MTMKSLRIMSVVVVLLSVSTMPGNASTGAEIGVQFRLSHMGPDGDSLYDASYSAVAYSIVSDEYLIVWHGDDLVDGEFEIFGQRLDASTGAEVGVDDFRLSHMGPDGDTNHGAFRPSVAYSTVSDEYLVVWHGDDLVDGEFEIFGQRLDASTGAEVGVDDFRLSHMGPDGNVDYEASYPAIAYNTVGNEYMIVWEGDSLVAGRYEIFSQRVNASTGAEVGVDDFRLSDMGWTNSWDALAPAIAYNSVGNEYMIVWHGDREDVVWDGEYEIWGQRVNAATGEEVGANDFRLSNMGPDGTSAYDALHPAIAYNSVGNEHMIVWEGDGNTGNLIDEEFEIFGKRYAVRRIYLPFVIREN
jgi:hypothetical protein